MAEAATVTELRPPDGGPLPPTPPANGQDKSSLTPQPSSEADWRPGLAGTDEKKLAFAKRFTDQKALFEKAYSADQMIAKGLHKQGLPENPTPEQITEYRKANGIPDKAEAYLENLPEGLVIGEIDKPELAEWTKAFQELNLPPAQAHKLIAAYYKRQEAMAGAHATADKMAHARMHKALREDWGHDYDFNRNQTQEFVSMAPPEVQALLSTARVGDGSPLGGTSLMHDPHFMRWLASMARELNPSPTVVGDGGGGGVNIGTRIAQIKALMGNRQSEYWKGPKDPATGETLMRIEYRRLLKTQDDLAKRGR